MDTMGNRLTTLIKKLGLTKSAFAAKLNLSQPFVSDLCNDKSNPSDRTILDICREFDVSEQWLRTGEGEMFVPKTRDQEIAEFMGDLLKGEPDFRRRLISVLARLDGSQWKLIEEKIREIAAEP